MRHVKIALWLGRGESRALVPILALAMVLRLGWLLYAAPTPTSDAEHYRFLAEGLLDHHQYGYPQPSAFRPPGYPFFLATMMLVSRSVAWLSMVNVILSTAICALAFVLAYRLFDKRVALGAALIAALNPSFVFYSPILASEHLFAPLMLGTTILALTGPEALYRRAALCGILLGAAILTRPEAIFYVPVIGGCFLWAPRHFGYRFAGTTVVGTGLVVVVAALVVLPWYIRNLTVLGPGVGLGTNGGVVFYEGHNPDHYGWRKTTRLSGLGEVDSSKAGYRLALEYLKSHPASLLRSTLLGTYGLYRPSSTAAGWSSRLPGEPGQSGARKPLAFLPAAKMLNIGGYSFLLFLTLLSLWTIRSWPARSMFVIGSFIFFNWLLYAVVFWGSPRYRFFPEVLFSICASVALTRLLSVNSQPQPSELLAQPASPFTPR